ncbi:hypothetical protein E0H75_40315 [Kribbella capetownensis]|uniref:Uncharacterized protein n=1 Tax=Kribbella capetownensis TaxID=1572659 RepID=A0A4R0IU19_9ACTN|nr:hypothetical protein [Kribbella capetownensis]TCC37403.1 hypothetical protein E0H75_40315 [Kribbella capetownensis]
MRSAARGARVLAGVRATPDGGCAHHLRLSFVAAPADLAVAVNRLQEAWTEYERSLTTDHRVLDSAVQML